MNDHRLLLEADPGAISRQLTAAAARVARTVAEVIERSTSGDAAAAAAETFLRDWADSAGVPGAAGSHPFDLLADRYRLLPAERELILLAGLAEEHEGLAGTLRSLHPSGEALPSVGLAALVLARGGVARTELRELLTQGRAIRSGLLRIGGPGALFERSITLADQLWEALHGLDAFPTGIERVACEHVPAGLDRWLADPVVRHAATTVRDGRPVTVLVSESDAVVALGRCAALARSVGARLLGARLRADDGAGVSLLCAHAAARAAIPVVVARPAPDGQQGSAELADRDVPGPVLLVVPGGVSVRLAVHRPVVSLPLGVVDATDRRTAWLAAIPALTEVDAATLAARHALDPALIAPIALDAGAAAGRPDPVTIAGLIRTRAAATLPPGVELVTPTVPWARLVLADEAGFQLRDAIARLEHQALVLDDWQMRDHARANRGVRLLLTGLPGTGKSLAAEALATATETDLLRVDVSQVVSKWIGETEKNLAAAFDAAERTQAVLLLDEADSLFGTRTEITDAHDRYANLETAFLLQRLDRFEGLAVLATNLRHNIDAAFIRRMDFVVDFPLPDLARRHDLWQVHLPPDLLADDVDIDTLARLYPIAGGWIRNAAVAAAFFAATTGGAIAQHHLVAAVRREYAEGGSAVSR